MSLNKILVVSGLGSGKGTGAATAVLFASLGYKVALVSRPRPEIIALRDQINSDGPGSAEVFSVEQYDHKNMSKVFQDVKSKWPDCRIRATVWNTSQWSRIPFLDITETDIATSAQLNIITPVAFAQESVKAFLSEHSADGGHTGGTIIFTGATSATRGKEYFGAFAAGKHGLRALSQSLAREYGPQGVHVSFVIIDGTIRTPITLRMFGEREGEAKDWLHDNTKALDPFSIAKAYLYLHEQDPSAWTFEMDLRPSKEKF